MNQTEKEKIINRYNTRLNTYGYHPKTLGWDKERHFLRYHVLLDEWLYDNDSLLDFGCGFGDLYNYIKIKKLKIQYSGIDINDSLVKEGIRNHKGINLKTMDYLKTATAKKYEYIVASGVHNFKIDDNWNFIKKTFEIFNKTSLKGFAMNFISDKCDTFTDHIYHTNPERILELAYKYSNRVILRNDYMPFEFTIFVNKKIDFDQNKTVYQEFLKYC